MHFVIADNNGTQILDASDANKYITDTIEQLYKEWYSFLWMSPNYLGFHEPRRTNIVYYLSQFYTLKRTHKVLLCFRKNIREPDICIHVYNITKKGLLI